MILLKFVKFCIVGFSGMAIDFGITWVLKERVRLNKYLANSLGFMSATISNFALNRYWTFHSFNPRIGEQYLIFLLISVSGLAINNLVLYLLHGRARFNFYMSKLAAVMIVAFWNFLLNYFITFR